MCVCRSRRISRFDLSPRGSFARFRVHCRARQEFAACYLFAGGVANNVSTPKRSERIAPNRVAEVLFRRRDNRSLVALTRRLVGAPTVFGGDDDDGDDSARTVIELGRLKFIGTRVCSGVRKHFSGASPCSAQIRYVIDDASRWHLLIRSRRPRNR